MQQSLLLISAEWAGAIRLKAGEPVTTPATQIKGGLNMALLYRVITECIPEFYGNASSADIAAKQAEGWSIEELYYLAEDREIDFFELMDNCVEAI